MPEPPVTIKAIHDSGSENLTPTRVVIHATCPSLGYPVASAAGQALSTARYFQSPNSGGSAHYVVDITGEYHCAADSSVCWHAPPNDHSIGIEICSEGGDYPKSYTREQWLSDAVAPALRRAASRAAELCTRFGIPPVRIGPRELLDGKHGICGHVDVSRAWHQTDHSDPGPCFPWPEFMEYVNDAIRSGGDDMTPDEMKKILAGDWRPADARNPVDMWRQAVNSGIDVQRRLTAIETALASLISAVTALTAVEATKPPTKT